MARRKVKNGEKSLWGQCLTWPVPNGRRRSGFWLAQCVTRVHVGIEVIEIVEEWGVYVDIFVVSKTLQEENALKEIPGRRDREIGTLPKYPTSALDFKDLSV